MENQGNWIVTLGVGLHSGGFHGGGGGETGGGHTSTNTGSLQTTHSNYHGRTSSGVGSLVSALLVLLFIGGIFFKQRRANQSAKPSSRRENWDKSWSRPDYQPINDVKLLALWQKLLRNAEQPVLDDKVELRLASNIVGLSWLDLEPKAALPLKLTLSENLVKSYQKPELEALLAYYVAFLANDGPLAKEWKYVGKVNFKNVRQRLEKHIKIYSENVDTVEYNRYLQQLKADNLAYAKTLLIDKSGLASFQEKLANPETTPNLTLAEQATCIPL